MVEAVASIPPGPAPDRAEIERRLGPLAMVPTGAPRERTSRRRRA
jgi:hypothetical protein